MKRIKKPNKKVKIEIRCSQLEKKLYKKKAQKSGLTLSEFFRRSADNKIIKEKFTSEQIQIYKMLVQYQINFKRIGNMFRTRDPNLASEVTVLANEIETHLKKLTT